ncbi:hypothetical protein BD626DRAFT_478126 [Schizophyllum amplum]|uniref:FAD-binding domain-containing protein n=1 Tax=Schizophyllum amplum TaxID=97359 RepID=A0A550D0S0_9AGAR|nr:hypothetical protein BD626DRAFT_478126 [Auriculariopsis ampla]
MAASSPKLRIAIVGGGIGGLSLVLALERFCDIDRLDISVFEAAPLLDQAGAGIGMYSRTLAMLRDLGLAEELAPYEGMDKHTLAWRLRKSDQKEGVHIHDMYLNHGPMMLFHRADFQGMILRRLTPAARVHLSHRLADFQEDGDEIHLRFENGTSATCDVLIGADGLRSSVRSRMADTAREMASHSEMNRLFAERADPVWTGTYAFRGLVDAARLAERWPGHPALSTPSQYVGKCKHITSYPIAQGKYVNIVPNFSDYSKAGTHLDDATTAKASTADILQMFEGWEDEVRVLIELMEPLGRWPIMTLAGLPTYTAGRVILLGDAAHAMSQHLGAGAGQGVEDAYVLGKCFAKALAKAGHEDSATQRDPVRVAAALYNLLRVPVANHVQERSTLQGRVYNFALDALEVDGSADEDDDELNDRINKVFTLPEGWEKMDALKRMSWMTVDSYNWQTSAYIRDRDAEAAQVLGI